MYSLSIICSFLSVWSLYAISSRVDLDKKGLSLWLSAHVSLAKILSGCFFLISTLIFLLSMGVVIALLSSVSLWILLASFTTLFTPFGRIRLHHLGLLIAIAFSLEFILSNL